MRRHLELHGLAIRRTADGRIHIYGVPEDGGPFIENCRLEDDLKSGQPMIGFVRPGRGESVFGALAGVSYSDTEDEAESAQIVIYLAPALEDLSINPFCKHGVWLGDANPNNPCAKCALESEGE